MNTLAARQWRHYETEDPMCESTAGLLRAGHRARTYGLAGALAWLCLASAHAANPLSISFTSATQKNTGGTVVWYVQAPAGSNMVIKAAPGVVPEAAPGTIVKAKTVEIKWKGFQGTDQVWTKPPPGPQSVQLDPSGQATVPIKFAADSYRQWQITACVNWQPPGHDHKVDDCVVSYLEGEDSLAKQSSSLILIVSPEHPAPTHNWKEIPQQGNHLGIAVQEGLVSKSPDKLVRLKYESSSLTSGSKKPWPMPTDKMTPKVISLAGVASQGGWVKKSELLIPDPQGGEWLTIRACMTIEYSGEVCSSSYAYKLTGPSVVIKALTEKNPVIDPNQPLPPKSPPPGGGGGGGRGGGEGQGNLMAPPPVLGQPASAMPAPPALRGPTPQSPPPAPVLAPAAAPAPADAGRMAPAAAVPGCSPIAAATGQYACASREAYAGCERQRVSGAPGIRACTIAGDGRRR